MQNKCEAFDNISLYDKSLLQKGVQRHYLHNTDLYDDRQFPQWIEKHTTDKHVQGVNFLEFVEGITPHDQKLKIEFIANGTYGYAFKCMIGQKTFVIKFSVFFRYGKNQAECQYEKEDRPENVEHSMLNLLMNVFYRNIQLGRCQESNVLQAYFSGFVKYQYFEQFIETMIQSQETKQKLQEQKKNKKIHTQYVKFLVCSYCDGSNLQIHIKNKLNLMISSYEKIHAIARKNKQQISIKEDSEFLFRYKELDYIFFSVIYALYTIQYYFPSFKHNDLKANNILLKKTTTQTLKFVVVDDDITISKKASKYIKKKTFQFNTFGYIIKIADMDFSCIDGFIDNMKSQQQWAKKYYVDHKENKYQDILNFTHVLRNLFYEKIKENQEIYSDDVHWNQLKLRFVEIYRNIIDISTENLIKDNRVPSKIEKTTPQELLMSQLFDEYLIQ